MKQIHILRSQCPKCNLDKMDVFYRFADVTPTEVIRKLKKEIRKKFKQTYHCPHTVKFTREVDPEYLWDEVRGEAVLRS